MILLVSQLEATSQPQYTTDYRPTSNQVWFNDSPSTNISQEFENELDNFVVQLEKKRNKYSELNYLRCVYYKIHRKYLKHYKTPSTLADLHQKRVYDCLTGTALYAMVFQRLGISYDIVETTYHVYLTLQAGDQSIVIESTSPLDGFIADPEKVTEVIEYYQKGGINEVWSGPEYYKPSNPVNNSISLNELAGLQHYNQAVVAFNQQNLKLAYEKMSLALFLYPSERLKEMMVVVLDSISSNPTGIDPLLERQAQARYGYLKQVPVASNSAR